MFKQDNQFNLIPQDYRSFLGESHEVIIFEEIINDLDLTELVNSYSNFSRGTSAYHPRMLLKVLFYGYMNQTFSSRKLAKKDEGITQTRINNTDKDSRLMQMKRKDWGNGYNPQNTTEKQFIISNTVPNSANDTNELIPAIEKIEKQY